MRQPLVGLARCGRAQYALVCNENENFMNYATRSLEQFKTMAKSEGSRVIDRS